MADSLTDAIRFVLMQRTAPTWDRKITGNAKNHLSQLWLHARVDSDLSFLFHEMAGHQDAAPFDIKNTIKIAMLSTKHLLAICVNNPWDCSG